jgi:transposase-like protein
MTTDLTDIMFHDEDAARAYFEAMRWPTGPVCPRCGSVGCATRMAGKSHRPGLFQCNGCRESFSVTVGTVMEDTRLPLTKWALAFHLMASSKKGVSAHQLHRNLHVTYKTAWFLAHRIREAMREESPSALGGEGKVVEADEMYHGKKETQVPLSRGRKPKYTKGGTAGVGQKRAVVALVERGGEARAVAMTGKPVTAKNVREVLVKHADRKSRLQTDESLLYPETGKEFAKHETVHHASGEYARGKGAEQVTTNSVEGFFGVFKRGFTGIYQHCGEQHFQRYLDEFTFRYNNRQALGTNDTDRAAYAVQGAEGKRLMYRPLSSTVSDGPRPIGRLGGQFGRVGVHSQGISSSMRSCGQPFTRRVKVSVM